MKRANNLTYTFAPLTQQLTITIPNFSMGLLYAVINVTKNQIIYAVGMKGYGFTAYGSSIITLEYDTTSMSASDVLMILYDDYSYEGGVYNSTLPTLTSGQRGDFQFDNKSRLITSRNRGIPTYRASNIFAVANTPTDVFSIIGSATKKIIVQRLIISATQTTAASADILINKRSTLNTGGTSTVLTAISNDSSDVASTATVRSYTANPTALGTLIGNIFSRKVIIPTTTGLVNPNGLELVFGDIDQKGIVLNSATESLNVNLNSVTRTGNSFSITAEWMEE